MAKNNINEQKIIDDLITKGFDYDKRLSLKANLKAIDEDMKNESDLNAFENQSTEC